MMAKIIFDSVLKRLKGTNSHPHNSSINSVDLIQKGHYTAFQFFTQFRKRYIFRKQILKIILQAKKKKIII